MSFAKKACLAGLVVASLSLLIGSASALRAAPARESSLGIEIALKKPFYIPAATTSREISAVVPVEEGAAQRGISAVRLVPVMVGDKVKVTVFPLSGDASNITKCEEVKALKSEKVATYTAGLDEEITISKLSESGVLFDGKPLTFRIVPRKVFPQHELPVGNGSGYGGVCECSSCGTSQCCPNQGHCVRCGSCAYVCCNP